MIECVLPFQPRPRRGSPVVSLAWLGSRVLSLLTQPTSRSRRAGNLKCTKAKAAFPKAEASTTAFSISFVSRHD